MKKTDAIPLMPIFQVLDIVDEIRTIVCDVYNTPVEGVPEQYRANYRASWAGYRVLSCLVQHGLVEANTKDEQMTLEDIQSGNKVHEA